jgi:hypothetical protein
MDLNRQRDIARRVTGKNIKVFQSDMLGTNGKILALPDVAQRFPDLPPDRHAQLQDAITAHTAGYINIFDREARKLGRQSLSTEDYMKAFADPHSPDSRSIPYVRMLVNTLDDGKADAEAAKHLKGDALISARRFLTGRRQGLGRRSIAQLETMGPQGKCSAFVEALFQYRDFGKPIEAFASTELDTAAKQAAEVLRLYSEGSIARGEALKRVMDALTEYCPPPWRFPKRRVPAFLFLPGCDLPIPIDFELPDDEEPPESPPGDDEGLKEVPEEKDELPKERFQDPALESLLRLLERIIQERNDRVGAGAPRWQTWSPGDVLIDPSEMHRHEEDTGYGVSPLQRRCVIERQLEQHLLALLIDSSGSVPEDLFMMLYLVVAALSDRVAQSADTMLGVGQFSGGASWVLEPTNDPVVIDHFGRKKPERLYHGGTYVREIYTILARWFSMYKTADLVVLTDGYTETGEELAKALEQACLATGCEIKLHFVVFKGHGSLKHGRDAKDIMPRLIRTWYLGEQGVKDKPQAN